MVRHFLMRALLLLGALMLYGCGGCGEKLQKEYVSRDGQHKAAVFVRRCGDDPAKIFITVRKTSKLMEDSYSDLDDTVLSYPGETAPAVRWDPDGALVIDYTGPAEMYDRDHDGVKVIAAIVSNNPNEDFDFHAKH